MKNQMKISGLVKLGLIAMVLSFSFASCDKDDDKPNKSLKINPEKAEVEVGKTSKVAVSGGTEPYTVTSSDVKIATVKADKSTVTITGVKKGSVTISVTDKNQYNGKVVVTVKDATSALDFDKKSVTIEVGKENVVTIQGGVAPYTAEAKDATIATATVKDGKVTIKGVKAGTTTITVADKDKKNSGTISVTIK